MTYKTKKQSHFHSLTLFSKGIWGQIPNGLYSKRVTTLFSNPVPFLLIACECKNDQMNDSLLNHLSWVFLLSLIFQLNFKDILEASFKENDKKFK